MPDLFTKVRQALRTSANDRLSPPCIGDLGRRASFTTSLKSAFRQAL